MEKHSGELEILGFEQYFIYLMSNKQLNEKMKIYLEYGIV